jgi:TonB family protein
VPKQEDNQEARLRLMDVPAQPEGGGDSRLRLPLSTPSNNIQEAAQAAAHGRSGAGVPGPGEGTSEFENLHPNFSTEAPIILSDTQGVDFGPYLARVVYVVRHNWYQVIPESARLGERGRVAVVFEIVKDGSVPQLRVVGSSGSDPLDRAALAGIRASIPFPPLPTEFSGNHLVLQFIFLYNLAYTNP